MQAAYVVGDRAAMNVAIPLTVRISRPAKAAVEALTVALPSANALTSNMYLIPLSNGLLLAPKVGIDLPNKFVKAAH